MFCSQGNPYYHTVNVVPGPVHCIAQSDAWLAIGSGKVVQLIKQATIGVLQLIFPGTVLTNVIHSYLGSHWPPSRPTQIPRAGRRAPRTYGAFPPFPRR